MKSERRYDIDWLRVLAFSLLIFYHTGMFFVSWDWHIKNNQLSPEMERFMLFLNQWRLPLLFVVSGVGVSFAMKKRSVWEFIKERSDRLLIPLIAGILLVVPPQVYIERIVDGAYAGNFLSFLPHFFDGIYPSGNFSWHHLWFVVYLFVFSVLLAPAFGFLKNRSLGVLERVFASRLGIFVFFLPFALSELALRASWPSSHNLYADWANFLTYSLLFFTGFLISRSRTAWLTIGTVRRTALGFGAIAFAFLFLYFWPQYSELSSWEVIAYRFVKAFNMWCWVLALIGFARLHLNRKSRVIAWSTQAVYPFYIVHQMYTIILAYWMMNWSMSVGLKFLLISFGTFGLSYLSYEFVIRRSTVLMVLFGVKVAKPNRPPKDQIMKKSVCTKAFL